MQKEEEERGHGVMDILLDICFRDYYRDAKLFLSARRKRRAEHVQWRNVTKKRRQRRAASVASPSSLDAGSRQRERNTLSHKSPSTLQLSIGAEAGNETGSAAGDVFEAASPEPQRNRRRQPQGRRGRKSL